MRLVRLIKMCMNESYRRVGDASNILTCFLLRMVRNKGMLYHHCFLTFFWNMPLEGFRKTMRALN